ncbi:hypothetical protein J7L01_03855 [bacterium]|nr:hypothetical protein [bacterium]
MKLKAWLLSIVLAMAVVSVQAKYVKPAKGGTSCKLVGGKVEWSYALAGSGDAVEWQGLKARHVKLYIRSPKGGGGDFQLYIDGKAYKKDTVREGASKKYKIRVGKDGPKAVSKAKTLMIKLAKGKHAIKLTSKEPLYVRLVTVAQKPSWITPEKYDKSLSLINGDKLVSYYSATASEPVVVKHEGAGTLTVWSRLAFDKNMKGTQHYTVVVRTADKKVIHARLETVISETSSWKNDGGVIPGKARTFKLDLAKGSNEIRFLLDGTVAPYCAFRFTITR